MKLQLFTIGLTSLALALGTITTLNQLSLAQEAKIFCGTSTDPKTNNTVPTTIGRNAKGNNVVVIRWVSNAFPPPYNPQQRCQIVSGRFQKFASDGTLKFIKTGNVNGQPVLCAASSRESSCTKDTVLLTLVPGSDANKTARDLMDHANLSAGTVSIYQSSCDSCDSPVIVENDGSVTVDVDGLLNSAPVVEGNIQPSSRPNQVNPKPSSNSNDTRIWGF